MLLILLALFVVGCGSGGGSSTVSPQAVDNQPFRNIGYAWPWYWNQVDPEVFSDTLSRARIGLTEIEYTLPDGHADIFAAHSFVSAMRKKGIWTFVNVANANNETVKGWARIGFDIPFRNRVDDIVNGIGPDHVILGAVSEPDESPAYFRWAQYARSRWTGEFAVPGNFPAPDLQSDWEDIHYCTVANLIRDIATSHPHFLFNTDCRTVLNPGLPVVINLLPLVKDSGNTLLIYDPLPASPDYNFIDAVGKALQ